MKLYYSISEVSKLVGVSNSQLRYWETEFPNLQPNKNRHGDRRYTVKDIDTIKEVKRLLKEEGYTIAGAKKAIKSKNATTQPNINDSIDKLEEIKNAMIKLRDSI